MEDASLQRLTTATLAAALLLGAATGARAQLGEILDPGAAYLFQLGHVTIVYPAGPGEDAERNRRSAERKAAFVGGREVRVTVRADTELTDEERAGNLLLLGWTNRLLETAELSGIVERLDDGFRFLGRTVNEPHADLLFFVPNPYDEYRDVMFWSRIDPELDRFMVLPVIGSHWAIFHDFLPVEQGMLSADRSWPPRRKPAAEKDHRNDIRIKLSSRASIEGSHYTLGYDPEVLTKAEARSILAAREAALARAADLLGTELGDFRGRLEIYADPTSKVELTGVPDPVHTLDRRGELHMVRRVARSASPHEEIHLLAHRDLGPAFLTAPYEGLVLLLENRHRGMDLELHAAVLIEKGLVPDLLTVLDDERLRALPEEARFPSAGLMMGWVRSTGGAAALERVYDLEAGTLEALGRALERRPETLEDEFRAWTAAWNRLPSPTLLVAPAGTAAQAIRESALKLDDLETLIIDGLDVVFALEDPAAFDTIVAAIPASAQRVVTLIERTPATDSFIAAQVRRAMVIPAQPAEAGQAEVTGAMSYIVVPPGQKITALARLLRRPRDVVPRIVTRSMAGAAAVREALQLRGWRVEPPAEQVSVVAATEAAQALIAYDVPFDAEALARLDRADGIIMVEARELPHLRAIAAQAGIQLTAVGGSRSTRGGIAAFRASVRAAIEEQDLGAQLALLGPLLEEHAPEEVAAALSALLRQRSSAPATATTASAEAGASDAGRGAAFVRLYISLGSRDGIRPGDLVGAITGEAAIAGDRVGKIDIRDNFSVVEVGAAEADRVIRALNGTTVKGRSLRVDYDRPQSGPARSGPARSGPTRSGPGPRRPRPDGGRRGR